MENYNNLGSKEIKYFKGSTKEELIIELKENLKKNYEVEFEEEYLVGKNRGFGNINNSVFSNDRISIKKILLDKESKKIYQQEKNGVMTEIELEDIKKVFDIYAGKILSYKEYMAELELEKQNIEANEKRKAEEVENWLKA